MDSRLRGNDEIAPNRNLSNVFVALLVAVDIGHYAAEPGVISAGGRPELEYNRDLALDLRTELQRMGLRVQLIGERGDYAVLLEAGVIVNRDEERRMRDPKNRRRIAVAVAEGVRACLAKEE